MAFSDRSVPAILRQVTGALLLLALAAVFFVSGWSKLQTPEPFAWSFIDIFPIGVTTASVIARIFIGLEFLIGAWLLAHLYLRRFTYKATIGLLLLLTAYLGGLILIGGNSGNCGCFGEWLYMSPGAAIWKNVAMIGVTVLLYYLYPGRDYRHQNYVAIALAAAAFALPFVLEPVYVGGGGRQLREPVNLDPLYTHGVPRPAWELRKGKHIVIFFSTTCPHCKKGAYLLQILHRRYPELPLFMALNGNEALKKSFLAETKAYDVPQTLIANTPAFTSMSGEYVPAIYWINNSVIERKSYYTELEPDAIRAWLKAR